MLYSDNVAKKYKSTRNDTLENFATILSKQLSYFQAKHTLGTMQHADAQFQSL